MYSLRSEQISKRLYWAMSIIILCLLFICVPFIVNSVKSYSNAARTYEELLVLQVLADLGNQISKERAPANKLMSSSPNEYAIREQELKDYRAQVDQQIDKTIHILKEYDFDALGHQVDQTVRAQLELGREQVDAYAQIPVSKRNADQLDYAVLMMFRAWDSYRDVLKSVVMKSQESSGDLSPLILQVLYLSDLRDQAGRVASNVMAYVTFAEPLPPANLTRALQTQRQVYYLWDLIELTQPEKDKTEEFKELHHQVEQRFIQQGIPIVSSLIRESMDNQPYSLTGTQLTDAMTNKFPTVIDLQSYVVQHTTDVVQKQRLNKLKHLMWTTALALVSLAIAILTMIFARKMIFLPLIDARKTLLQLSQQTDRNPASNRPKDETTNESLFSAIQQLQHMLQQRDAMEFRLKNIAHSDSLTGLSNRFALDEYIKFLQGHPSQFTRTCLMMIDIDHFKQVNDQYGHIVGDEVIRAVADAVQYNVRTSDLVVRYGGDELLVLIENIEIDHAVSVAQKIRQEIEQSYIAVPDGQLKVTVSIGVAVGGGSWTELFTKADDALFEVKVAGRNGVAGG